MSKTVYIRTATTGGTSGCLDYIDGDALLDGDVCFVYDDKNNLSEYILDADANLAEHNPYVIVPDANPSIKCWILRNSALNQDVDTGTETVDSFEDEPYYGCVWNYAVGDGTNLRAGTITAIWNTTDDSTVEYIENSTGDIGDTSGVSFAVNKSGSVVRLRMTTISDSWVCRVKRVLL